MLIGIISDIHDRVKRMRTALTMLEEAGCTHLIFLGDAAQLATLRALSNAWPHEIDYVLGNNDYPRENFRNLAESQPRLHCHGDEGELSLPDTRRVFITHEPYYAGHALNSGAFDAIFYGHTHRAEQIKAGETLVLNPGDIQGRYGTPSCAIYDTATNTAKLLLL